MKYEEISLLALEKITEDITSAQEELRKLRFAHAISPLQNPARIRHTRRHIARLKTAYRMLAQRKSHAEKP